MANDTTAEVEGTPPKWADIEAAGNIRNWVDAELERRGLRDPGVDTSRLSDKQRKAYKAKREEERRVRRVLQGQAWQVYRQNHLVHVGVGVWYHDTADIDRWDIAGIDERRELNELPELKDVHALAKALELPIPKLRWLVYHREVDTGTHYQRWTVPKRSGKGVRLISAPKPTLKRCQTWVARNITEHLPVHGAAHGFLTGRSTVTNAAVHAGARVVVKFDVKDFYPTVSFRRVKGMMRKAGYGEQVATVLALLTTECPRESIELHGRTHYVATGPRSLPQGAPTSPSITNALCLRLDSRLTGLARKLGFRYTRYADDLTFSFHGAGKIPVGRLQKAVADIVKDEGFIIHPHKTRVMRKGGRQKVTGLVINGAPEGAAKARVPRKVVRELRAAIRNRELGKPGKGESLEQLRGMAAYIHMCDPAKGKAFLDRINALSS
ncbi:RNA-directed DNA polymerase domain protein [Plesiocystis pacifica SIR-1]|uniref:RNA-directed DNA polymerase n=1 Tax=Plesiocystis pacifica SIR-1 TaxID=391625 RepID=A6GKS9_9BACT|nr:reverse transcriptase family protein [Plesiocystis pacifica]EDM73524.1 RNA-directed DNA polymerase domain protein [Plesiocystis pacifica SIR-1]